MSSCPATPGDLAQLRRAAPAQGEAALLLAPPDVALDGVIQLVRRCHNQLPRTREWKNHGARRACTTMTSSTLAKRTQHSHPGHNPSRQCQHHYPPHRDVIICIVFPQRWLRPFISLPCIDITTYHLLPAYFITAHHSRSNPILFLTGLHTSFATSLDIVSARGKKPGTLILNSLMLSFCIPLSSLSLLRHLLVTRFRCLVLD